MISLETLSITGEVLELEVGVAGGQPVVLVHLAQPVVVHLPQYKILRTEFLRSRLKYKIVVIFATRYVPIKQ